MTKTVKRAVTEQVISLAFLLLVYFIANKLIPVVDVIHYETIVVFANSIFWLVLVAFLMIGISEILLAAGLPYSLAYPICTGISSAIVIQFIFMAFGLIDNYTQMEVFGNYMWLKDIVSFAVFLFVLVVGYFKLHLMNLPSNQTNSSEKTPEKPNQSQSQKAQE